MNMVPLGTALKDVKKGVPKGNHRSAAEAVLEHMRADGALPVVFTEEDFWRFEGACWRVVPYSEVEKSVASMADWAVWTETHMNRQTGEWHEVRKPIKMSSTLLRSVVSLMKVLASTESFFDHAAHGISFENGFVRVDPEGGGITLEPHAPEQLARVVMPMRWDPEAPYGKWEQFLDDVFEPDEDREDKKRFLAQFLGACLTGYATTFNRAVMLTGRGANGKSILCDMVAELFPKDSVVAVSPHDMSREVKVARLATAKLNLVSDIPTGDLRDAGSFKQITSGDPVEARRLYQNPFSFRPKAGHLFSCNSLPQSSDHTAGFYRRWVVLKFSRQFLGRNARPRDVLERELMSELPGIMRWALEGAVDLMKERMYLIPPSHEKEIKEWQISADQVASFIDERCVRLSQPTQYAIPARKLYEGYAAWAKENGHRVMSNSNFGRRVVDLGIIRKKTPRCFVYAVRWADEEPVSGQDWDPVEVES
jgi:P4 family phage/plasmid primase-like protien